MWVYMIATGFLATISPRPISYIWYIVSCAAYLATAYMLVNQYRREAERNYPRAKKTFRNLITVHLVLWTIYPIVWILSAEGLNILNQVGETMGYTILDIASKVGFGFLSLNTMGTLEKVKESSSNEPILTS
jgi:bacteriorhodopsin